MTDPGPVALLAWLLPAGAFVLLSVAFPLRRSGRPAAYVSILVSAAALGGALLAWRLSSHEEFTRLLWEWLPAESGPLATVGVLADPDSTLMLILVTGVSFLVQVYSLGYLADEPPASLGRYYTYQSLFAFSMMGLVLAPNFVQLFICWELVGLCSYLLIGYWYQRPEAARAAVKAFWVTKAGDVGLLIGIVLLGRQAGTFDFVEILRLVDAHALPLAGLGVITFCIYLGAVGKSAQFPLHVWLPDAMEGPTPVSALIHAATMVTAGVYLLTRTVWLFQLTPGVLALVGWVGAFTALLAATLACVQSDIKRVLAYSTVSQLGYMMAAIGAGFAGAGFLHLLTHGVFKALLFLAAGAVIHAVGTNDIFAMGGLARRMPQTLIVFLVGTLSLAGIPLFGGFFSKEEVLGAVWTRDGPRDRVRDHASPGGVRGPRVDHPARLHGGRGRHRARLAHVPATRRGRPEALRRLRPDPRRRHPTLLARRPVRGHLPADHPRPLLDHRLDRPLSRGRHREPPERLDALVRRPAARHPVRRAPGLRLRGGARRPPPVRVEPVGGMSRLMKISWGVIGRCSSAGFAGATLSWGEVRKGGEAPLRVESGVPQDYVYAVALGVLLLFVWSQF